MAWFRPVADYPGLPRPAPVPDLPLRFARQEPQLGTGHAVQQAVPVLADDGIVLILNGDVPLVEPATLQGFSGFRLLQDRDPLTVVLVMALVTLATRWGGVFVMAFVPISDRARQFITAMSGSVLVAIVAPIGNATEALAGMTMDATSAPAKACRIRITASTLRLRDARAFNEAFALQESIVANSPDDDDLVVGEEILLDRLREGQPMQQRSERGLVVH